MSKRSDAISSLFRAPPSLLSADNKPAEALRRVAAGSVRSLQSAFSDVERENVELRQQLDAGLKIIEVDTGLISPSPFRDRFDDAGEEAFDALKNSIKEQGQEIPVLLRENPAESGRYQIAYGHRRVRAARELGRSVKAVIRQPSDVDLAISQGLENAAREDLTFIERAIFALRLEEGGQDRAVIQQALTIDRAEASKLISVGRTIPATIVAAIGRAPKVGRPRWLALADALDDSSAQARAQSTVVHPAFSTKPTDTRFALVLAAAQAKVSEISEAKSKRQILSDGDIEFARVVKSADRTVLTIKHAEKGAEFAAFVEQRLPEIFAEFKVSVSSK